MEATTKDLRLHTARLLAAVDRGEDVVITFRGHKRARLTRYSAPGVEDRPGQHNPAFGLWADRDEDVDDQVRSLRQPRRLP